MGAEYAAVEHARNEMENPRVARMRARRKSDFPGDARPTYTELHRYTGLFLRNVNVNGGLRTNATMLTRSSAKASCAGIRIIGLRHRRRKRQAFGTHAGVMRWALSTRCSPSTAERRSCYVRGLTNAPCVKNVGVSSLLP